MTAAIAFKLLAILATVALGWLAGRFVFGLSGLPLAVIVMLAALGVLPG